MSARSFSQKAEMENESCSGEEGWGGGTRYGGRAEGTHHAFFFSDEATPDRKSVVSDCCMLIFLAFHQCRRGQFEAAGEHTNKVDCLRMYVHISMYTCVIVHVHIFVYIETMTCAMGAGFDNG